MTAAAVIKQADLERILKAAKAAETPVRVEVEPGGKVVIIPIRPGIVPAPNLWDDD